MKTKLLFVLGLVLVAQASFAQFQLGVKGGVNITKVDGKSFSDEFRYGYHLGGFAEIELSKKVSIQPEVLFNQYNTRVDSTFKNVYQNALSFSNYKDVQLNYLTIPLLLNYKPSKILSLQLGPQFGILIDKNQNLVQNGKSAFNTGEFSMLGGAQLNLGSFKLSGRYILGLNNISDIGSQEKWKNQGFQLSVGYRII